MEVGFIQLAQKYINRLKHYWPLWTNLHYKWAKKAEKLLFYHECTKKVDTVLKYTTKEDLQEIVQHNRVHPVQQFMQVCIWCLQWKNVAHVWREFLLVSFRTRWTFCRCILTPCSKAELLSH